MVVLVTGSTGFIGSHLVKRLREEGEKVVSLIHDCPVWTKWLENSMKHTIKVHGDIRDFHFLKRVISHYEISHVFHLAAMSIVKHAYKDPINTYDINVMGTVKLLEACRQLDVEWVLVQTTDKIFGNQRGANVDSKYIPTEPYGTSKICCDVIARSFAETYGMNIVITRCCNVYGYDWNNRIIPNTIKACLRGESPIIYKNDKSERQYIYIDDVIDSFIKLFRGECRVSTNMVNIATPEVLTQEEVVLKILEFFPGLKPRYVEKPGIKQIKSQSMIPTLPLEYTPFDDGIQYTIHAFKKYREDWD